MSSFSDETIPSHQPIVLGCGQLCLDYLVTVSSFPNPDQKIRCTSSKVQGGGNTGNSLTCVARLGLPCRILAKVADDSQGRYMVEELESSGVDTSFCLNAKDGASHFNYVIVDNQTNTRTCIYTPGYPPLLPDDLTESLLLSVLDGVRVLYVNGRSREAELLLAQKAHSKDISILINAEKRRAGLEELLDLADYAICSTNFPQDWTESPSSPSALLSMLIRLPKLKFVIMTLGEHGCVMLERCSNEVSGSEEETDIDELHESLKQSTDYTSLLPVCNSSLVTRLAGNVTGRLVIVTAEKIPSSELIDTTGAGDAFTGALLYGLCTKMATEKMLTFASRVAACCCRGLGARTTLPFRTDPNLATFLATPP
ncbi:PREDICTED: ketohexokinase-like isoform X1 [Camelina sativa]|uniref:Ketohexokinase-like isoform X1 n=1 Tax=Camelina sativa TaxID=90675 RepID=A0ABM0X7B8_CAMSA|nr:PREDICTED: ketohexokinase-like isoform X1 [Camelina sativa]